MVRDGHAMGVATEIGEDLLWPTERRLGINPPLACSQVGQQLPESARFGEICKRAIKGELIIVVSALQTLQEQPPKQTREHVDGEKESATTTDPALSID